VQEQFAEKFLETPVPHRNAVCRLSKRKSAESVYEQIKWVQAHGHHFQQLL
jgi:hypothetical protein